MNPDSRNLLRYGIFIVAGGIALIYFKRISSHTFEDSMVIDIIFALIFGTIFGLYILGHSTRNFKFLNKPLWGVEKISGGYRDISIKQYPHIVKILFVVVLVSLICILYFRYI